MSMHEPSLERLPSPLARYVAATRPGFLGASAIAVLIGLASASRTGPIETAPALLTLLGALSAHAGVNVLNDVHDHHAGCDGANSERIYPFTGGSRVIQNGVLDVREMSRFGWALMGLAALVGVLLLPSAGAGLLPLGASGLALGWAYSAPPLRLCERGLGELAVGLGFGVLIPIGTALVQGGRAIEATALAAAPFAFLVACVLFVNEFPDARADAATGKRNLVVRLGPGRAWALYPVLALGAFAGLALAVHRSAAPPWALVTLAVVPLHLVAAADLARNALRPRALTRAVVLTLAACLAGGALLAGALAAAD